MSQEREALVHQYIKTRDSVLRDQILEAYRPLVDYIVRRLCFHLEDKDDLTQLGVIGLLRALDRFEPSHETDFSTFATPNVIGEIKHYFRDKKNIVKIPRRLQEVHGKVRNYLKEAQQNFQNPSVAQIAKAVGVDEEIVLESLEAGQVQTVVSLDTPNYGKSDVKGWQSGDSLGDTLGDSHHEDLFINRVALKHAISKLEEREQYIVDLRFYKGLSQREIASHLGLSQMHISRILAQILKKLRKTIEQG